LALVLARMRWAARISPPAEKRIADTPPCGMIVSAVVTRIQPPSGRANTAWPSGASGST
jgi:hypothetical protein